MFCHMGVQLRFDFLGPSVSRRRPIPYDAIRHRGHHTSAFPEHFRRPLAIRDKCRVGPLEPVSLLAGCLHNLETIMAPLHKEFIRKGCHSTRALLTDAYFLFVVSLWYHEAFVRIGIHTSRAKSLETAALTAHKLGANAFQIFSASPRMWRAGVPDPADVKRFRDARARLDLTPLAIHTNYLINLASLDPVTRERSIVSFRGELDRAAAIGAEYLILHPGSYKGQTIDRAIEALVAGLADATRGFRVPGLTLLLENTVGSGAQIGSRFEELRTIRHLAFRATDLPIAYCLDTCHLLAAGNDIARAAGLQQTIEAIESNLGLEHVHVIHANDSKGALNSHRDRHANIGEGHIGEAGFRRILRHPKLSNKAFILETPVDEEGDDKRNVDTLKRLSGSARKGPCSLRH
jgi:deoxyribonuclease-4